MKMSKTLYEKIKNEINDFVGKHPSETAAHIEKVFNSKDFQNFRKRITWDIFWAVNKYYQVTTGNRFYNDIYAEGLLDSHIETAISKIVK